MDERVNASTSKRLPTHQKKKEFEKMKEKNARYTHTNIIYLFSNKQSKQPKKKRPEQLIFTSYSHALIKRPMPNARKTV